MRENDCATQLPPQRFVGRMEGTNANEERSRLYDEVVRRPPAFTLRSFSISGGGADFPRGSREVARSSPSTGAQTARGVRRSAYPAWAHYASSDQEKRQQTVVQERGGATFLSVPLLFARVGKQLAVLMSSL